MHVFGLTGGIGSGKSSVAGHWRARGLPVVDADELARRAVDPGTPALARIAEELGADLLQSDGSLDRSALAARAFGDAGLRQRLNQIVHPEVRRLAQQRFGELERSGAVLACYEVPLLFETGQQEAYRPVVLISVPPAVQRARALARDGTSAEAIQARIDSQMPLVEKARLADYVIDNSGPWSATTLACDQVLGAICEKFGVDPARFAPKTS